MGSYRRMCMALGVQELDDVAREIEGLFKMLSKPKESILDKLAMLPKLSQFASWMPKVISGRRRLPGSGDAPVLTWANCR